MSYYNPMNNYTLNGYITTVYPSNQLISVGYTDTTQAALNLLQYAPLMNSFSSGTKSSFEIKSEPNRLMDMFRKKDYIEIPDEKNEVTQPIEKSLDEYLSEWLDNDVYDAIRKNKDKNKCYVMLEVPTKFKELSWKTIDNIVQLLVKKCNNLECSRNFDKANFADITIYNFNW